MIATLLAGASGLTAFGAAAFAILSRPAELDAIAQTEKAGRAGERRVARALERAGIPELHDLTIRDQHGTHQIDHIAAAGDCLYVIETKTWRGRLCASPAARDWSLTRPAAAPVRVYNPILQNETHTRLIRRLTQMPVASVVIMVGHVAADAPLPEPIVRLPTAILRMTQAGRGSPRALAALDTLGRLKCQRQQPALAARHRADLRARAPAPTSARWWRVSALATVILSALMLAHLG